MKIVFQKVCKLALIFVFVVIACFALTVGTALIPRRAIRENMHVSAEYMCEKPTVYTLVDFIRASQIDHFADCMTLSIAYYLDEETPVRSAMLCSFYGAPTLKMNEHLLESVETDIEADREYLRYWHGSSVFMRFFHLFWNIQQIYIFHAVILSVLIILLVSMLIRYHMLPEAIAFVISMAVVSIWYVPFCLETTWMFLVMLPASIIAIRLSLTRQYEGLPLFFLLTGMVAAYIDFLTAETLTLLVPLLFMLRIRSKQALLENWKLTAKGFAAWGIGYLGMWVSKWVIASIVLQENVMPYVIGHINERLVGDVGEFHGWKLVTEAIRLNLKTLFPYEYGISGAVLVFAFILICVVLPVALERVVLRKEINWEIVPIYLTIGFIPFIRFTVLSNHSYIHRFMTHRALAATALALCFIVFELVDHVPRKSVIRND